MHICVTPIPRAVNLSCFVERHTVAGEQLNSTRSGIQQNSRRIHLRIARWRPARLAGTRRRAYKRAENEEIISSDVPDFELVQIPGNGSCMFQAIAQSQSFLETGELLDNLGLQRSGFQLRRNICLMLVKHRGDVEPFLAGDFESYLHHMATEGVWGGEPELAMAVKVVERPILVYRVVKSSLFSGSQLQKSSEYGVDSFKDVPPVCILFDSSHYDSLLPKS